MKEPVIIPQKFSFTKDAILDYKGKIMSPAMDITITIDAFKAEIKKDLAAIFTEILEYFD